MPDAPAKDRVVCAACGEADDGHLLECPTIAPEPSPPSDEPWGTCVVHGDFYDVFCPRCGS